MYSFRCRLAGRVWDLRTGRSIMTLEGHVKSILALDFAPNGYQCASGSEDHSVRVWDLRKRGALYMIPAHQSLVSQVRLHILHIDTRVAS
jgi:U4/U6 small nuclear ribonucleoprotein PRP4